MHGPALTKLLTRAQRTVEHADSEALRYRLLGYALSESHDHPDAWLSYQVDTGTVAAGAVLRADPVHLRADQQRLVLFDAEHLHITSDEAQALAAAFNHLYAADGLRLEALTPTRWYLHLPKQPELCTTPLVRVVGRDIDAHLPTGHEARDWRRFLNEVQMLFHDHPVNREREARGQPLINSLWLWGGGRPLAAVAQDWQGIWATETRLLGLARLNGIRYADPPVDATAWLHEGVGGRHLLSLDVLRHAIAYGDVETWLTHVEQLEQAWFAPLLAALRSGHLRELRLYPVNGYVYRVTRRDLWCFWRRPQPEFLQSFRG
ncbi:MAG: hypothetical protein HY941_09660 [Gammaproteobacteria bacterium]|nr:hypothetical protein [Gammaproteobacteria bacterium]